MNRDRAGAGGAAGREHLTHVVVTLAFVAAIAIPFTFRARSIAALERAFDRTSLGEPQRVVVARLKLRVHAGQPPATYQNVVWWRNAGTRGACTSWGVTHGGLLAPNYALLIGFDAQRRVAFKALGNT